MRAVLCVFCCDYVRSILLCDVIVWPLYFMFCRLDLCVCSVFEFRVFCNLMASLLLKHTLMYLPYTTFAYYAHAIYSSTVRFSRWMTSYRFSIPNETSPLTFSPTYRSPLSHHFDVLQFFSRDNFDRHCWGLKNKDGKMMYVSVPQARICLKF